jgi:hypothetical protein
LRWASLAASRRGDQRRHALGLRDAGLRDHLVGQPLLRAEVPGSKNAAASRAGTSARRERRMSAQCAAWRISSAEARVASSTSVAGAPAARASCERGEPQRGPVSTPAHRPDVGDQRAAASTKSGVRCTGGRRAAVRQQRLRRRDIVPAGRWVALAPQAAIRLVRRGPGPEQAFQFHRRLFVAAIPPTPAPSGVAGLHPQESPIVRERDIESSARCVIPVAAR